MSNTRKLRPSLLTKRTLYGCAVCRLKFHTPADRAAHYKIDKGARLCQPVDYMKDFLSYRFTRGAWMVTGSRSRRSA